MLHHAACFAVLALGAMLAQARTASVAEEQAAVSTITPALCAEMKRRRVLNAGAPVGCERLRRVTFGYVGFDGQPHRDGEIVVLDVLAEEVAQIFTALHGLGFPIAKARGMEHYDGDDDAAIADNNTSSFNHRTVAGSSALSLHAYGV